MNEPIRVYLLDDSALVRADLRDSLQSAPDVVVVGESGGGDDALPQIASLEPDVVILDCQMAGMDGAQVAATLRERRVRTNILAYSEEADEEWLPRMLNAGAVGYLPKRELHRVLDGVRIVANGQEWFGSAISAPVAPRVIKETWGSPNLTERELAVLRLLAQGKDNPQISVELSITERTVRFHVQNICDKIGVNSDRAAVVWAIRNQLG